jgi:type IV secretory pathway protease TraF
LVAILSAIGVLFLCVASLTPARFVWNVTASAPSGIYAIDFGNWSVGDRVAVQPARELADELAGRGILPRGKLLIKRIAAGYGDEVCRIGDKITVNGAIVAVAKSISGSEEPLPTWAGCRNLTTRDVFLLGETVNSFDGRYFGPTSAGEVLGRVSLILRF